MNSYIAKALDNAYKTKTNVLFIGPVIGKSGSIIEWAKKNKINGCHVFPDHINPHYSNVDRSEGVLIIEPRSRDEFQHYTIPMAENICNGKDLDIQYKGISNLVFKVIVLSTYEDCAEENATIIDMLKDRPDWSVVNLDYDKRELLSFCIDQITIIAELDAPTEERISDELEEIIGNPKRYEGRGLSNDGKSPAIQDVKEYLTKRWVACQRAKAILEHLMDSPNFEINSMEMDGRRLGLWMNGIRIGSCSKEEFLDYWKGKDCYQMLADALIDYEDPNPVYESY